MARAGRTWVAAKKALVASVAEASTKQWTALDRLLAPGQSNGLSHAARDSGASVEESKVADHSHAARDSAARKLLSNRHALLRDVTNPARWTNVRGKPLTQLELVRVHADLAVHVDEALRGYMTKYDCSSADVNVR